MQKVATGFYSQYYVQKYVTMQIFYLKQDIVTYIDLALVKSPVYVCVFQIAQHFGST